MFSDDDEDLFDMELADDAVQPGHHDDSHSLDNSALSTGHNGPAGFHQLVPSYQSLRAEIEEVDEMARQLKIAMDIRKQMERCSSRRSADGKAKVISCATEIRHLSSGSSLFLITISNGSIHELHDWHLTLSAVSLDQKSVDFSNISQTVSLGVLPAGSNQKHEIFLQRHNLSSLPLLVRIDMIRLFSIEVDCTTTFRIELDGLLLSLLNSISLLPADTASTSKTTGSCSLSIPCSLVNLLSGCPDDDDPAHLLRLWLRPSSNHLSIVSGTCSIDTVLRIDRTVSHRVSLTVSKQAACFQLTIAMSDGPMRSLLLRDTQLLFLVMASSLTRRPKQSVSCLPDLHSISQLFESVVSGFQ